MRAAGREEGWQRRRQQWQKPPAARRSRRQALRNRGNPTGEHSAISGSTTARPRGQQRRRDAGLYPAVLRVGNVVISAVKPSQTYLKFPDQTAWVSLSVGYPRMVATRPVSSSE